MMRATIRETTDPVGLNQRRRLPEPFTTPWTVALIFTDALAVLAACYVAGLSAAVAPATCVVVCGMAALFGLYQRSYAVRWYDDAYAVVASCAAALIPLWILLHVVAGLGDLAPIGVLLLSTILMGAMRATFHLARHGSQQLPNMTAVDISPESQWRVRHGFYPRLKRTLDIGLAATALLLASPLMILAAVCVAIESGFPVLFRQERVARDGGTFVMYKFRTMWQNADTNWAQPGDRRITNVGALLRRSSLDEFPQLFNVLRGEMSLVGPRPEMPQFARGFRRRIPHYDDRHIVTPGVTGWAQAYAKRNLQPEEMQQIVPFDLFYVEHASMQLDAVIIAKTAAEFLFHRAV